MLARSEVAPTFNTRQRDREIPKLSKSEQESEDSTRSTILNSDKKGVNTLNPVEVETGPVEMDTEKAKVIKSKNPQIREALKWQIEGSKDKFLDGL